jgi:hypothetical protein
MSSPSGSIPTKTSPSQGTSGGIQRGRRL